MMKKLELVKKFSNDMVSQLSQRNLKKFNKNHLNCLKDKTFYPEKTIVVVEV